MVNWIGDNPNATTHHFYDQHNVHVLWAEVNAQPLIWGVMIGNIVHNLRSALDHLVWELVKANGEQPRSGPGGNQFPILDHKPPAGFDVAMRKSRLRGIHLWDRQKIATMQPYRRPYHIPIANNPLLFLAGLSNTDKHRFIVTTATRYTPDQTYIFHLVPNRDTGSITDYQIFTAGRLYTGAVVAWAEAVPVGPNPRLDLNAYIPMHISFENGWSVIATLTNMLGSVEYVIDAFDQ
jgi:hypothetical protein